MSNDGPAEDDWIGIEEKGANLILKLWAEVEKLRAEVERMGADRDEARAEVAQLLLGSDVLASHQGSLEREWHGAGAWLYPGDTIKVVRAPLPEKEAKT